MDKRASPTIVDVAEAAGVSIAAVSKVMRGSYGVSPQMRETVSRAIAELGYRPKVGARSLRGTTFTLGFVVPGVFSPFFSDVYGGVADEIADTRYRAIVALASLDEESYSTAVNDLLDRQVDGIILIAPQVSRSWIEEITSSTAVVVVARHDESTLYDTVCGDDEQGALQVMRHLFELGHRDIVHIANHHAGDTSPENPHGDQVRRQVYERCMREANLADNLYVLDSSFDERAAYLSTIRMFESGRIPSAIFAGADEAAFGAQRAIAELPGDLASGIAVVSYDNTRFADHPGISLTSVDQPGHELGRRAAELLLDRLGEARPSVQVTLRPRLIVRRSSVPAPASAPGGEGGRT
ncbi:LacI family DNA-binding transcriptional regulator [Nonomuraea sp. NPDC005650]|uniref:LacI family DNA-binding transcriptional regulator n=1 Tax=Nonomuraea sp. NPDC005650 TaxID=3157045 RepID=UPI0033BE07CC